MLANARAQHRGSAVTVGVAASIRRPQAPAPAPVEAAAFPAPVRAVPPALDPGPVPAQAADPDAIAVPASLRLRDPVTVETHGHYVEGGCMEPRGGH
ncbi:hypothetical protein QFZ82_004532 [Streptomyces sp. V4I23]|uniref:hypothetical protein n=1 Tax=Streptomyces sp. V4I23 TaxID=3042282 RepID=UPI0027899B5F|nr:hypothetical protein [Streptomyces sp. V4I23]MDQ1010047.1 hypothetical protein [Streptomyces sp. V4I23]